ncbi:SRPBCC domain-containing protein [Mycolicibacterium sp. CBMA 226]|uniref:SRPBCC domain-containing protein n=1 Tax=Mycolicibacterium sp. CBMA 226 TaxID=2606611 RepID=UPI0012DD931C|nr:SRPBCC domain-containing protein [Mycolicibacterium sp. CBMA 226]MUL75109.1 SRPBCC domain-containing protein [Mycolicibacterium sp. CBMA 226]
MSDFLAKANVTIAAPAARVWNALTDPDTVAQYFFGARVETDWQPGSAIVWRGEFNGKAFEDKGEIIEVDERRLLQMTHFSSLSGQPDKPENYHTLSYDLDEDGGQTRVSLTQDNNATADEAERSSANWSTMLSGLKRIVEAQ